MRTQLTNALHFIRLDAAAKQLGAQSKRQFVADLRTLPLVSAVKWPTS